MGLLFVESIRRLFKDGKVSKEKIVELYESKKITEEEMKYILEVEFEVENNVK